MARPFRKKIVPKSEKVRIVRGSVKALREYMTTDLFERAFAHELRTHGRYDSVYREFCGQLRKVLGDGLSVIEKRIVRIIRGRR